MTTIFDVLDELRSTATDERDKGDRFERLMAAYLRTDPLYERKYSNVWLWNDWSGREGKIDTGIDLVAEERDGGGLCAIQCKCYDPSHSLQKSDIDSFFTASGKAQFSSRMVISTTDKWSQHAEDALENQQLPVQRLRVQDLDESPIDWSQFSLVHPDVLELREQKHLRPHQFAALEDVKRGLSDSDRGKLIMACGTGKTFTSLKIMEDLVPPGGLALFLVPSISLLSQTMKEWSSEASVPLKVFAVCSDVRVGRRTDSEDIGAYDLAYPASTDPQKLVQRVTAAEDGISRTIIFSTYQSLGVISQAQALGVPEFDLVICDEAHRTTGVTLAGEDESSFVAVHNQEFLRAKKRLYMTATPRIYDDSSKSKAEEGDALLCSMDDESFYGPELHRLGFGDAVGAGLLSDYKVLVLAVDEQHVSKVFQAQLSRANTELNLDDAAKIVGCWNGLSKRGVTTDDAFTIDSHPMTRAVAFARTIKDSKRIAAMFTEIVDTYSASAGEADLLSCEIEHVDGTYNALRRNEKLDWLREETGDSKLCRVLSNVKCLSEGVDVPALDAVMFLNPRNSIVDVVQSVGRVMRKSEGKSYGYVILPIGIPSNRNPDEALNDNKKYQVVWQVLQALRAHDDRFDAMVNKIDLNKKKDDQLQIIGIGGGDGDSSSKASADPAKAVQGMFNIVDISEWRDAIYAKIVQKVGDRRYWEDWATDVAGIANRHITRINTLLASKDKALAKICSDFVAGLRLNLNDSISTGDAIEMLSQHLITKPVFDALFADYSFATHNPVSLVMQTMVDALDEHNLDTETESLERFYESVRLRADGIDNAEGRQRIITELYERFFKTAFSKTTESLGVVYTPIEIVDFIIQSVEATLADEFGVSLSDAGVHILDPFTGTGTFMVRLIQSGILEPDALANKYASELHANEIVLLAYYIAAINIEAAYHDVMGDEYHPFEGIVLTDTFQMFEGKPADEVYFPQNNARASKQKLTDIRVIIGNPPYSIGQGLENDDNKNLTYPVLDQSIRDSYAAKSTATNKRSQYDSYIRAFRWASDRLKDKGVICFVSNGSYIDTGSSDGFRKSLVEEFNSIYCFNLRGNQRTAGDTSRREGGKIFGSGSRTPVAITLLVKNPDHEGPCHIHYRDIGDSLTREEKLRMVSAYGSVLDVPWEAVVPDSSGDWINHRNPLFDSFQPLGAKKDSKADAMFDVYSVGLKTNRDAWTYNFSKPTLLDSMRRSTHFYGEQQRVLSKWSTSHGVITKETVERLISNDTHEISWSRGVKEDLRKGKPSGFDPERAIQSMYRPFCKQWLYFDRQWNEMVYQIPKLFPTSTVENLVISASAGDARRAFSALITDCVPDVHLHDTGQCFPLYHYIPSHGDGTLFSTGDVVDGYRRHEAITDVTLERYMGRYGSDVTKEDIFFYVYGVLHSPEYRKRFNSDLNKMIPRIPMAEGFAAFMTAGRRLASCHLNYESTEPWRIEGLPDRSASAGDLRVQKMKFGKKGGVVDKSTIIFNPFVTLNGIPDEAYGFQVNGRSAIEWIMDRYEVSTNKDSGIVNDPNDWSDDPRYVLDLIARIIRVSMETVEIVNGLPSLGI